ncbi:MAG: trypsin-like peptidase domain-containing protein [Pirellulales bacterium]|nr:trypsin-like peptidase domain-containing protein [Pirellulales bacterium]
MKFCTVFISLVLLIAPGAAAGMSGSAESAARPGEAEVLSVDPAVLAAERRRIEVIDRAKAAVVAVFAPTGRGGGSGVVVSPDGLALTNFHVAKPSGQWMKCGMADGKIYDAVLVGLDPTGDVALIRLFGRDDFPAATLGDSDGARPGDWVFAMGNPFLLATNLEPTVSYGIISGTHRYQYPSGTLLEYTDCLQTDAAINPGNSGGPLFDAEGRLIGINGRCSFEKRGRVSVGVGYAISINQVKNFLGSLESGRIVDHATLGFRVGFDDAGRVLVDEMLESSDAYRRGLRYGDEIVGFAGRPIDSPNTLKNLVGIFPKGWRLPLVYRREGKRFDALVRLAGLHHESQLVDAMTGRDVRPREGPKPPEEGPGGRRDSHDPSKPGQDGKPQPHKELIPSPGLGDRPQVPEVIQKHYAARRGYANYFFNRRHQERLWREWTATFGDFEDVAGTWAIAGTIGGGKPFRIEVGQRGGRIELPAGRIEWTAGDDLAADLAPPHTGGLLPALYLWRRLAVAGLDRFGEVYYLGTAPLAGDDGLADVLVGVHGGVTCWFYFDRDESRLAAIEMFSADDADPCEVYFSDYRAIDGRAAPGTMEVRFGDEIYGRFTIDGIVASPESE